MTYNKRIPLALSQGLREVIADFAICEKQTLNGMIIVLLAEALLARVRAVDGLSEEERQADYRATIMQIMEELPTSVTLEKRIEVVEAVLADLTKQS